MGPDDEICCCYHVTLRKLENFAQRERPANASRMSECLGAGTGCGWCIPILKRIAAQAVAGPGTAEPVPAALTPEEYARRRQDYIRHSPRHRFDETKVSG